MRGPGAAASGDATKGIRRQPGLLEMEDAAFKGPPFAQKFRKARMGGGVWSGRGYVDYMYSTWHSEDLKGV